jgi:hypothetical protein
MNGFFPRGAVVVSIDTELIWGYLDLFSEDQFRDKYPDAVGAHDKLLTYLRMAGVSATWFVVGAMALRECAGSRDPRLAGLPLYWTHRIPEGRESAGSSWFYPSFIQRLRDATPFQEIGLHGGLTHLVWTDLRATREAATHELLEGVTALQDATVRPRTFSYARAEEAHYDLLPEHGIRSYRGPIPALAWRMGNTVPGALMRALDELCRKTPPAVWPTQTLPGLWNVPASLFLYPLSPARTRVLGLRSRVERFSRGIEAAMRNQAIFHFCLHPENLTESPQGFSLFEAILERLVRARERENVEVLTMSDVVTRMERNHLYVPPEQLSHARLLKANWRS